MSVRYYTLDRLPDFTMAKYSNQESSSVEDIMKQHASFYRQLHRRGQLFKESYSLIYWYEPDRPAGQKIRMLFRAESDNDIILLDQFLESAALSSSFQLKECDPKDFLPEGKNEADVTYPYRAIMVKKSGKINSSLMSNNHSFYVVDEWKSNEDGRLLGMFRLMRSLNASCVYAIHLHPTELSDQYRNGMQNLIRWMKQDGGGFGSFSSSSKDENADKCEKSYNEFLDKLRSNPHFYCEVSAYAEDPSVARLLVDAAAAEAVEEGNYNIYCNNTPLRHMPLTREKWYVPREDSPDEIKFWSALFLLKEVVPLAAFPTLYPGENIEIPKETAPLYEKQGLYLGKDQQGYDVYVPFNLLPKHALLAGVPGSGKTFTMLHLASQMSSLEQKIPILVLEPAKQEYRALAKNPDVWDLTVFAPGGSGAFPLRINPFEFPEGMKLAEHIVNLRQVFIGAFDLEPPMPFLLDQGIENVYRSCGWYPFDYNDFDENGNNIKPYPNMQMLFTEVEKLLDASDYAPEISSNLKSVLQVRIGSLISRETGNVFNVPRSTFRPEEWMSHSCVIELESLGKDASNFLTLLLATIIREIIKQNPKAPFSPRHVIFFEEAHNLIGPTTEAGQNGGNAKVASTKFIVDMLAEVRALKEAIIVADQLPTALASQVTKNTSLKIGLRITAQDDREMLASTMSADGVQLEQMALFNPGHALCLYEGVQKPFEVQIAAYRGDADPPDNEDLYRLMLQKATYQECMERDFSIMKEKLEDMLEEYNEKWDFYIQESIDFKEVKKELFRLPDSKEKRETSEALLVNQENSFRNKYNLCQKHLEQILAFGEYACVNHYKQGSCKELLIAKWQEFIEKLYQCDQDVDFPLKKVREDAEKELIKMSNHMRSVFPRYK